MVKMMEHTVHGSRYHDGNTPNVNSNDGKFKVNNVNPDNANDNWGVREKSR